MTESILFRVPCGHLVPMIAGTRGVVSCCGVAWDVERKPHTVEIRRRP